MNPRDIRQIIDKAIGGMRTAFRATFMRSTEARVILLSGEGLSGEPFDKIEHFQQPGLRSKASSNVEMIVVPLHGRSAHGVAVAMQNGDLYVQNIQEGEIVLFNEKDGHSIHLKNGKIIEVNCEHYIINTKSYQLNTQTHEVNATTSSQLTSPRCTTIASSSVLFTTPIVQTSQQLTVGNGFQFSGYGIGIGTFITTGNIESTQGQVIDYSGKSIQYIRNQYNIHINASSGLSAPTPQM